MDKNTSSYLNARDFGARGSAYTTTVSAICGSNVVTAEDVGDFAVGDEVVVTKCCTQVVTAVLHERRDTSPMNPRKWTHSQPIGDRMEFDGYDGSQGDYAVYFLDFDPDAQGTLRWTNNFGEEWHEGVAIREDDWTEIEQGLRVNIHAFKEREYGCTAVYVCTDRMVAVIEKIEGNQLYLSKAANKTTTGALLHSDSLAIQRAIDAAAAQKKSVFLPNGRYRIAHSLYIEDCGAIAFEGESGCDTILDKSFPHVGVESSNGSCFIIRNCKEVVLKNLLMLGCSGFAEQYKMRTFGCLGGDSVYGFYYKKSNATFLNNNESVYIENCHAKKMSAECFYAAGLSRETAENPDTYRRSITYSRCTVEDCARNAFNNNDHAERTSILNCRMIDVAGNAWEGASRFVTVSGCYMRNTGPVACGNVRRRSDVLNTLGTGQILVTNNYFEGGCCYGDAMITSGSAATQIVVQNNIFVNFNGNAIRLLGECGTFDTPSENIIISGNCMDMTASASPSVERFAIKTTACFTTISDNQIFVRGEKDENFTAIILSEDLTKISIHDNTISGCDKGIYAIEARGAVGLVKDEKSFFRKTPRQQHGEAFPRLLRRLSDLYRGWHIVWEKDGAHSEIEIFDWESTEFKLKEPREMCVGDAFRIYNPHALPWLIHHNIIDNCNKGIDIEDTFGGQRAMLDHNLTAK